MNRYRFFHVLPAQMTMTTTMGWDGTTVIYLRIELFVYSIGAPLMLLRYGAKSGATINYK